MILSPANIKKTINYCKKNGFKAGFYATLERIEQNRKYKYTYVSPDETEIERQRLCKLDENPLISIIVPAYETEPIYIEDLILSVADQTYGNFQLIIADASATNKVERMVTNLQEQYGNIEYYRLPENKGISGNSNAALEYVKGDYVALLDHDDILTVDALYEVARTINKNGGISNGPELIYSDEDKTNTYLEYYYEPNIKGRFNKELLMTNNYICHLSVFKTELIKKLGFREEYDGAQDYDIILRAVLFCREKYGTEWESKICHIPKVLYHWRCHESSTAQNPESKMYAYEAGRKVVQNYASELGFDCHIEHLKHLGFYRVVYNEDIFSARKDVGVVGGPVFLKNKIIGGAMDAKGKVIYEGLSRYYSGVLHRASLVQEAEAVDIRTIRIRKELIPIFEKSTGISYDKDGLKKLALLDNDEIKKKSLVFCNKLKNKGITVLYDPQEEGSSFES